MMLCTKIVALLVLSALVTSAWPKRRRMGKFAHVFGKRSEPLQDSFLSDSYPSDLQQYGQQRTPDSLSVLELARLLEDEDDSFLRYMAELLSRREDAGSIQDRDEFDV